MATPKNEVKVKLATEVVSPKVSAGLSTYFGLILTLISAVGAIVAALDQNDTATVTAGASAVLVALTTIGGRMAQAIAVARQVAEAAAPFMTALNEMEDPEAEAVVDDDLPDDEEEFAAPPEGDVQSAITPDPPR